MRQSTKDQVSTDKFFVNLRFCRRMSEEGILIVKQKNLAVGAWHLKLLNPGGIR